MSLSLNYPTVRPTLLLDFINTDQIDPRITFSRASSATYFNSNGILTTAATNALRRDYNPSTLAPQGFLVEEQRTNLLLRSAEFSNPYWLLSRATISADVVSAPDGTTTADKLVEDTTAANTHYVYANNASVTAATTYTFTVFLKAAERTFASIEIADGTGANGGAVGVNLTSGTIGTPFARGTGSNVGATISAINNGWYRVSITAQLGAAATTCDCVIYTATSLLTSGYPITNGDGVSGIYVWGAQLEAGAFPTSYIPTTTTALTRSADVASTPVGPWYNATVSTLYTEFNTPVPTTVANSAVVAGYDDGTANNRFSNFYTSNTGAAAANQVTAGAANYTITGASGLTLSNVQKQATRFQAGSYASSANGAAVVTDSFASAPPTVNTLRFGLRPSGTQANMWLRRVMVYPSGLSNAQLQAITSA